MRQQLSRNPYQRKSVEHPQFKPGDHAKAYKFMLDNYDKPHWAELASVKLNRSKAAIHRSIKYVENNKQWFVEKGLI